MFAATAGTAAADDGTASDANAVQPAQTSQPFLAWGDAASYELAPDGDFSDGLTGWTVSGGAQLVAGDPADSDGGQSLKLPAGSSATSPPTPIASDDPDIRFFTLNNGDPDSGLSVSVTFTTLLGFDVTLPVNMIWADGSWQPSPRVWIAVNDLAGDGTIPVQFTFTPVGDGDWQIDDLYVDPWGRT